MSVVLGAEMTGTASLMLLLEGLTGEKGRRIYARALNDTGFYGRDEMKAGFREGFDRVTPYIERSPKVFRATPDNLSVSIAPTQDTRNRPGTGGKIGMDAQKVLQAQEFGGRRADKKSELALRRAGILPNGFQTSIPRVPFPGSDDGHGNIRGAFMQQLLSYLQAYSEVGFKANMSDKRKAKLRNQQGIGNIATKKVYKTTLGKRFFVSYGSIRGHHLPAGIWAASGTHDVDVKPVLMFVRRPSYEPGVSMDSISRRARLEPYLEARMLARISKAAGL